MKKISIIVPCYNEHETIEIFYNEVIKHLDDKNEYKIIFVNDGSNDNSLEIMQNLAKLDERVLYVSFSRNFGKEAALYAGLEAAKIIDSDCCIQMDVDLQDPPYLIPELIKKHDEGFNLVITRQKNRKGQGLLGKLFSLGFYKVFAFVTKDKKMAAGARDYCLMDRKVLDAFLKIRDYERFTKGIYNYIGFRTTFIEFEYQSRVAGETKWNFRKLFKYACVGLREFSRLYEYIPKIIAWLFTFLFFFDTGYGIYHAIHYDHNFFDYDCTYWSHIRFDLAMILIFIVLFYIFRLLYEIRFQAQHRPIYICEDTNIEKIQKKKEEN